jgi:hypothetical protein
VDQGRQGQVQQVDSNTRSSVMGVSCEGEEPLSGRLKLTGLLSSYLIYQGKHEFPFCNQLAIDFSAALHFTKAAALNRQ